MEQTGKRLSVVASQLSLVEKSLPFHDAEVDSLSVMEVLESVSEVKAEYQNLQKDIKEVRQLQGEMTIALNNQLRATRHTLHLLKKRLASQQQQLPTVSIRSRTPPPSPQQ